MTMQSKRDVIIIGAGTAGLAALKEVEKKTDNYLLINEEPYGTTCARVGCMPSKSLIEAANAFHKRHAFAEFGIRHANQLSIDIPAVLFRVRKLRDYFVSSTLETIKNHQSNIITGRARLLSADTVTVNDETITAKRIIIATGSSPIVPKSWQTLGDRLLTTDSLFEQTELQNRLAVIGLGPIGIEMAQALSRLGIKVSAFGKDTLMAGLTDKKVNSALFEELSKTMTIYTGHEAKVTAKDNCIQVTSGDVSIEVDQVLVAVGRKPNMADIGFDMLGVELDDKGMPSINSNTMQVADTTVFVAGDAAADNMILHEVADEGRIAGFNAVANKVESFCRRTSLKIVFSDPQTAVVGKSLSELNAKQIVIGEVCYAHQGRARIAQHNLGVMRLYADKNTAELVGAEMCAPNAEHMAHILALAVSQQLTVNQILAMPIYHPVLEEGMRTALRDLQKQLDRSGQFDLSRCDAFHAEALD